MASAPPDPCTVVAPSVQIDANSPSAGAAWAGYYNAQVAKCYLENYYEKQNSWQKVLAGIVGVYSIIKQYSIMKDYLKLAKEQVKQADRLVALSERNYNEISLESFNRNKALFDRYNSEFAGFEKQFVLDAFRDDCYTPDYTLQAGRAIGAVQAAFDSAGKQRLRARGKYNAGSACHDATWIAIETAKARTAAVDRAYRFEESRQWRFMQWYWQRKTQGVAYVGDMAGRVVSGVNGAAAVANSGFGAVSAAINARGDAVRGLDAGYSNMGNFFGGLAQQSLNFLGYQNGRSQAAPFAGGMNGMAGFAGPVVPQQASPMVAPQGVGSVGALGYGMPGAGGTMGALGYTDGPYATPNVGPLMASGFMAGNE